MKIKCVILEQRKERIIMEKIRNKKVADSMTETTKLLQYKDINGQNRLFGGRLMEWIDEIAALTAMRHCGRLGK